MLLTMICFLSRDYGVIVVPYQFAAGRFAFLIQVPFSTACNQNCGAVSVTVENLRQGNQNNNTMTVIGLSPKN